MYHFKGHLRYIIYLLDKNKIFLKEHFIYILYLFVVFLFIMYLGTM